MQYKQLGNSSLSISKIGYGCMSLGRDETENIRVIHRALDLGINFFDTADIYEKGENETRLGRILKGKREQVILATKVGNELRKDGSGWDWNPQKEYIIRSVDASLSRLQTDRIDLYMLHGGTLDDPIDETIEAFEILQQQGKIRYYGLSSIRPNVIREWVSRSRMVSVMMQYSLLDRRPEEECLGLLEKHGIGVLARGSLAKGLLAGKAAEGYLNYSAAEVEEAARAIEALSGPYRNAAGDADRNAEGDSDRTAAASGIHRNAAQTAIQFVLQNPAITSAIVGLRTRAQLEEIVKEGAEIPTLLKKEIYSLFGKVNANKYELHR